MGLAGRKEKQRIGNDPRNLSWADDASKFGAAYLQKLGWSAGTGLGTNGDGRTSHVKVSQKLDMLGIGAAHQKDPNGIAWKQNKEFENLLRRLNAGSIEDESPATKVDGFAKASQSMVAVDQVEGQEIPGAQVDVSEKETKKRKRSKIDDDGGSEKPKKAKKEKRDGREKRKKKDTEKDGAEKTVAGTVDVAAASQARALGPPHRAHRARFMAAKRRAVDGGSAMDEILGISRSGTSTPYPATSIPDTPVDTPPAEEVKLQELTISSKSVMDYFKEKLKAKSNAAWSSAAPSSSSSPLDTGDPDDQDYDDRPRGGLGLGASRGPSNTSDTSYAQEEAETSNVRRGLGASSVAFASAAPSLSRPSIEAEAGLKAVASEQAGDDALRKKKKKGKTKETATDVEGLQVDTVEPTGPTKPSKKKRKVDSEAPTGSRIATTNETASQLTSADDLKRKDNKDKKSKKQRQESTDS